MEVSFKEPWLSITSFPSITLPDFVLITGPNGSGKSHLLQAMKDGRVSIDGMNVPDRRVRFDWTDLVPGDTGSTDANALVKEKTDFYTNYDSRRRGYQNQLSALLSKASLPPHFRDDPHALWDLKAEDIAKFADADTANQIEVRAAQIRQRALNEVGNVFGRGSIWDQLRQTATRLGRSPLSFSSEEILFGDALGWGSTSVFKNTLGRLFVEYRNKYLQNALRELQESKGQQPEAPALSDVEFKKRFRMPPWEFANAAFKEIGLNFEIDHPNPYTFSSYQPELRKLATGASLNFGSLSSGEKILMSLALCLYHAADNRETMTFPELLLLDEVDAPLHPSMCKQYVDVVTRVLVKQDNVKVIAATHSPSTVALAPEESIFVMRSDPPRLEKCTKSMALNALTEGVPTISLSYEGRRQVFVESEKDARVYGIAYQALKTRLLYETSIEFIETGTELPDPPGVTINSGCTLVRDLVRKLRKGNHQIFGLIDWDGKNFPGEGIHVLAHQERYSMENVFLDPLLLGSLLARDFANLRQEIGLSDDDNWPQVMAASGAKLQSLVSGVGLGLFGPCSEEECIPVEYFSGLKLKIDPGFVQMQGHELESLVKEKFSPLKRYRRSGELLAHIATVILGDKPDFTPISLVESFREVLKVQIN